MTGARLKSLTLKLIFGLILISLIGYNFPIHTTSAQTLEEQEKKLEDIRNQISDLTSRLEDAKGKAKTLKDQLSYIDTQTSLTKLKIDQTTAEIVKLDTEITDLSGRISRLSVTVDSLTEILLQRIVQTYKYGNVTPIDYIFSSNGFEDLLLRAKYIQVAQEHDKKLLVQLQATKDTYNDQKSDKEDRQKEQQKLKADLLTYQQQLEDQKAQKEELLRVTQNDEVKFQALIASLKAEQDSIANAISNIGITLGPVDKGQTIAAMGSTGCSTGPHLHFEVYKDAKVENGAIHGTRINPHDLLDNGQLGPPIKGYPGETMITTEYGEVYFLGTHTGLDIAPKTYEGVGRPILAADKGTAYGVSAPCNLNIAGGSSVGKGVVIDHGNGIVTLYWHVL